jgi:hypothetical protein
MSIHVCYKDDDKMIMATSNLPRQLMNFLQQLTYMYLELATAI